MSNNNNETPENPEAPAAQSIKEKLLIQVVGIAIFATSLATVSLVYSHQSSKLFEQTIEDLAAMPEFMQEATDYTDEFNRLTGATVQNATRIPLYSLMKGKDALICVHAEDGSFETWLSAMSNNTLKLQRSAAAEEHVEAVKQICSKASK